MNGRTFMILSSDSKVSHCMAHNLAEEEKVKSVKKYIGSFGFHQHHPFAVKEQCIMLDLNA